MKGYYKEDPWCIIEEGFDPAMQEASESLFSLGNGFMGQRANFEEQYSGETLQGTYLAGIYYPDKTRVGWWKNGYPEYFAKVPNAPNWIGIDVEINGVPLDLHQVKSLEFRRVLNMQQGFLDRNFRVHIQDKKLEITSRRFLSMKRDEVGAIRYSVRSLDFSGMISFLVKIPVRLEGYLKAVTRSPMSQMLLSIIHTIIAGVRNSNDTLISVCCILLKNGCWTPMEMLRTEVSIISNQECPIWPQDVIIV